MFAVGKGQLDIVKQLVAKGADIHVTNNDGLNALQIAVGLGKMPIIKLLVSAGGNIAELSERYPKAKVVYRNLLAEDTLKQLSLSKNCAMPDAPNIISAEMVAFLTSRNISSVEELLSIPLEELSLVSKDAADAEWLVGCAKKLIEEQQKIEL